MSRTVAAAAVGLAGGVAVGLATLAIVVPQPSPAQADPAALLVIRAEGPSAGYSRALFPHWSTSRSCSTRDRAMGRDMTVTERATTGCKVTAGTLTDPYTGLTVARADVDVDHVVPLAEAWQSGAAAWPTARRKAFANDMGNLVSTSARQNRSKGDQDPGEWLPADKDRACTYIARYVTVKVKYGLAVDPAETESILQLLAVCS